MALFVPSPFVPNRLFDVYVIISYFMSNSVNYIEF